mmetsp:Transcript_32455/g.54721  ORF Transcript_32455/g.54721 Transcript_32455/m.54721 type:complete len:1172 (-) Transcript_32455:434-3949(-)
MILNLRLFIICALLSGTLVVARCPNSCSGHGSCGPANICTCYPQWNGGAADCSQRVCPNGTAWADKAYAADFAHQQAECSNTGICNRKTGDCECFAGFTGNACQRASCPNDCSGHGVCSTIADISLYKGPDYDSTSTFAGDGLGITYTNWDKDSIQLCECDPGFFGADCTLAMCPKGDDPLTINQNYRSIYVEVQTFSGEHLEGRVGLQFMGEKLWLTMNGATLNQCQAELALQGHFGHLHCYIYKIDRQTYRFTITFFSWPTFPRLNNLYSHDGNPSKYDFYCDLSEATRLSTCVVEDQVASDIREYDYCSNRGFCNFQTGDCVCNDGFGGPACSNVTYLHTTGSNALPGLQVNVQGQDYTSSVVELNSQKSKSADYNFIEAIANSEVVFYVRGDGTVGINKLLTLQGGQTVSGGGLFVESGGATIADTGLKVFSANHAFGSEAALVASTYGGPLDSSFSALRVTTTTSTPAQARAIEVLSDNNRRFAVLGNGHVIIYNEGLSVTGGITLNTLGLSVTGGTTIKSLGLVVESGGIQTTGGITISNVGLKVITGGMQVFSGGGSIYSGGLRVVGGETITSGGFTVTGGISIGTQGIQATGGISIYTRGLDVTGGVTVGNSGIKVTNGVTINSDGLRVTGGASVMQGGLHVTDGLTVHTSGAVFTTGSVSILGGSLQVASGSTIESGIFVLNGGVSVKAGGLYATNGISVGQGGLFVTDGVSIMTSGLTLTGGVTVLNGGLYVTSGVTIADVGVRITGGDLSVNAGSLRVSSGGTIEASGMLIKGGTTIQDSGLSVTGGATVRKGGFSVTDGLTVSNSGLQVTGGATFKNAGVGIAGGLTVSNTGAVFTTGSVSINAGSLQVASGSTVEANGMMVKGGMTVNDNGLFVTDGLSVMNAGIRVTGGVSILGSGGVRILAGGLQVTGGASMLDGLFVTAGCTIGTGGGGVAVKSAGTFEAGLTVQNGLAAENGLTVTGQLQTESSPIVYSDRRLKTNLAPISDALSKVGRLQGVYFNWIADAPLMVQDPQADFDERRHVGVIAQDVLDVLPEVVAEKDKGQFLGVDYAAMVPLLIEAMNELQEQQEAQQRQFDRKYSALEQRLEALVQAQTQAQAQAAEMKDLLGNSNCGCGSSSSSSSREEDTLHHVASGAKIASSSSLPAGVEYKGENKMAGT